MRKLLPLLIILLLAAFAVFKLVNNKRTAEDRVFHYDAARPVEVSAVMATEVDVPTGRSFFGTFEPGREVKVSPDLQGRIVSMKADLGHRVAAGEVLAALDDSLLRLQLRVLEVKAEGLAADVRRFRVLADADAIQRVQLEKAELGLKAVNVETATVREQLRRTAVLAPFSGIITQKMAELGAFAAPGAPMFQLTDIAELRFTVNVPEADLSLFREGRQYTVTADAMLTGKFAGTVTLVGSRSDMSNNFPVQLTVKNRAEDGLRPGMMGRVTIAATDKENGPAKGIMVPTQAVIAAEGGQRVYVVENGKAMLRDVVTGIRTDAMTEVRAGIVSGDTVITSGFVNLRDGLPVAVVKR